MKKIGLLALLLVSSSCTKINFNSHYSGILSENGEGYQTVSDSKNTLKEVYKSWDDTKILTSTGEQKILVIPIEFSDYTCAKLTKGCAQTKQEIDATFFGDSSSTGWESVKSFYEKSSYGKLKLTGEVTDWFKIDMTASAFSRIKGYDDPTHYALRSAVDWVKTTTNRSLEEYDQDHDGFIDAVWMVYSLDYSAINSDVFWAYTYWDYNATQNFSNPVGNLFAWASYKFMSDGKYQKPDAHTFIHETGHLLGLDDYYNYDSNSADGPTGQLDMMDFNIGDHNAFSKSILGWTTPYVATGNASIVLNPFESSGDSLIIGNGWLGNFFHEYLIIEFYTPTGLNNIDASERYMGTYPKLFTESGIKIYHVDARLAKYSFSYNKTTFQNYVADVVTDSNSYTQIAHSNTPSRSTNKNYRLLHLLESSGFNTFAAGNTATNDTLFQAGDVVGETVFRNFMFNDGRSLPYNINIVSIDEVARIEVTAKT